MTKFEFVWKVMSGPKLIPEYRFHPTRKWRVDWWHESGVAIEIEGSVWAKWFIYRVHLATKHR